MKNRLITLLKMGRTLDWAKDRKGAYSLRYVNKLSKIRTGRAGGGGGRRRAGCAAPLAAQPSLFGAAKAPAAAPPPNERGGWDGSGRIGLKGDESD